MSVFRCFIYPLISAAEAAATAEAASTRQDDSWSTALLAKKWSEAVRASLQLLWLRLLLLAHEKDARVGQHRSLTAAAAAAAVLMQRQARLERGFGESVSLRVRGREKERKNLFK